MENTDEQQVPTNMEDIENVDTMRSILLESLTALANEKLVNNTECEEEQVVDRRTKRRRSTAVAKDNVDNPMLKSYSPEERAYYKCLTLAERKHIADAEKKVGLHNNESTPLRFKILSSKIADHVKAIAIKKLDYLNELDSSCSEYYKISHWIDSVCKLPIGIHKKLPITCDSNKTDIKQFLVSARQHMDNIVYGHKDAKEQIIRLLAQWIVNPESKGMVIGIHGPMGCGKCFAKDTPILMYDGTLKKVQDVQEGDLIMGDDSTPRSVMKLGTGMDMMYRVDQGPLTEAYIVNSEHILCLKIKQRGNIRVEPHDASTDIRYVTHTFCKDRLEVIQEEHTSLKSAVRFLDEQESALQDHVLELDVNRYMSIPENVREEWLLGYMTDTEFNGYVPLLQEEPYNIGMQIAKHTHPFIPDEIKFSTRHVRRQFISGLFTGCGFHADTRMGRILVDRTQLGHDLVFVMRSLGIACVFDEGPMVIHFNVDLQTRHIHLEKVGMGEYFGFTLDGNGRFLLGDFTVTHNTTLIKDSICKVLDLPFAFIPLGGASDGCYLDGHSYTYEGATWGKIVDTLMKCKCMNPVLYFDELDKVSETNKGEEIINMLIHLTDQSQNEKFNDKYFVDFDFDLSKSLIIFSYNHEDRVSPILRDRMIRIETKGYNITDKVKISINYMLPIILKEYNFQPEEIIFGPDIIKTIIETCDDEDGVRNLKRALQNVISHLNLTRLINDDIMTLPYTVTSDDIKKYVHRSKTNACIPMMYC
jgi:hypothetical protein